MKKRRKFLVNKKMQYQYIKLILMPLVLLLALLYFYIYYQVFRQMLIPEAVATTLVPAMRKVNIGIITVFPVLLFFIVRTALVYSNRIIGPVPRLERILDKAINGDLSVRIKTVITTNCVVWRKK